jgi:hypothetical protein
MREKDDFSLSEQHETLRGGESVVIRRVQPEDRHITERNVRCAAQQI